MRFLRACLQATRLLISIFRLLFFYPACEDHSPSVQTPQKLSKPLWGLSNMRRICIMGESVTYPLRCKTKDIRSFRFDFGRGPAVLQHGQTGFKGMPCASLYFFSGAITGCDVIFCRDASRGAGQIAAGSTPLLHKVSCGYHLPGVGIFCGFFVLFFVFFLFSFFLAWMCEVTRQQGSTDNPNDFGLGHARWCEVT
jgi:hypothetical protein